MGLPGRVRGADSLAPAPARPGATILHNGYIHPYAKRGETMTDWPSEPQGEAEPINWACTNCGYRVEGEPPPEKCPDCGADKEMFDEVPVPGF